MSDLDLDKIYGFDELPEAAQEDFLVQFEDDYEFDPNDFCFQLKIISYDQLTDELESAFGENLVDYVEDDYVYELAENIRRNGLRIPPIGNEGVHRKLAHYYLKKDILRFEFFRLTDE